MLYDMVAEFFGVENDHHLQTAVDKSGVSLLDWMGENDEPDAEARKRVVEALNKQADAMIIEELASGKNKMTLEDMLHQLNQLPNVRVTGMMGGNRKARRAARRKEANNG